LIDGLIDSLVAYALSTGLIGPADTTFTRNALLSVLKLESYMPGQAADPNAGSLPGILDAMADWACQSGLCDGSQTGRELLQTALMGVLTPWPSRVVKVFTELYRQSASSATDYFYKFCQDCHYIHRDRTAMDLRWQTLTDYGFLDITINLSKPEKDPRDIAAARNKPSNGYPACVLCAENEGYAGRFDHPARQNLRLIPVDILGEEWSFQYSPYIYYNEHCILLNNRHVPMVIDDLVFAKLFSFVEQFPHYFMGSNADLPIVGGSILSHEHFQGGRHEFAMARAPIERHFSARGFADVEAGVL
jgi:UDPglucose--hexose-1-phosphate uridylyltransferase